MSDFKKLAKEILENANKKQLVKENMVYPEGLKERMHRDIEEELKNQTHSLGKHPIFPEAEDNQTFEQQLVAKRFEEVTKRYKRAFDVDNIDHNKVIMDQMPLVHETMGIEGKHKKELEKLAIDLIRKEYDISEDVVEIQAELTNTISLDDTKKSPSKLEFDNHDEILGVKEEVKKRRFLNAMTQGAAKKCNHMFHMVDEELTNMDHRLVNKYSKLMSMSDYMYFVIPKMDEGVAGGVVRVQFPTPENPKTIIFAKAMCFPVLINELVKGVMEILSAHGLPKDKKIGEYVISKADALSFEPGDMRLGPALWSRFTDMIDPKDFNLKHHVYSELAALPVKEFNIKMKEIMAGTKEGKKIIENIINEVKSDLRDDDINESMAKLGKDKPKEGFSWDELGL